MNNGLFFLQCLLYMDFGGNPSFDLTTEHCFAIKSNCTIRACNRVCNQGKVSNDEIITIKKFFDTIPFTWAVDENDLILSKQLEENGLTYKFIIPAMSLNLDQLKEMSFKPEISVKRITNQKDIQRWIEIVEQGQSYSKQDLQILFDYFKSKNVFESVRLYLAYYLDQPAAACMLIDHKDVVCVHMVNTHPEYRNKGLAFALVHGSLWLAKAVGNKHATLLTYRESKKLYSDLGFEQYAAYKMYGNY